MYYQNWASWGCFIFMVNHCNKSLSQAIASFFMYPWKHCSTALYSFRILHLQSPGSFFSGTNTVPQIKLNYIHVNEKHDLMSWCPNWRSVWTLLSSSMPSLFTMFWLLSAPTGAPRADNVADAVRHLHLALARGSLTAWRQQGIVFADDLLVLGDKNNASKYLPTVV